MDLSSMPLLPGARPITGHTTALRTDRMGFVKLITREALPLARLVTPFADACVACDPAVLQEVLVSRAKSFEKADMTRFTLYPLAGEGLFTSRGALWRRQRKLMAPLFQPAQLERYAADMVECAAREADRWRDGETIEVARETTHITMSIAGKTLFDTDTSAEADAIGAALTVALEWTSDHAGSPLAIAHILAGRGLRHLAGWSPAIAPRSLSQGLQQVADRLEGPVFVPGDEGRALRAAVALLDQKVQRMIDERRAAPEGRQDLLTRLLEARDEDDGRRMSDKQVRDEVLTLFVAGHETTAAGLAWTLDLLARHPDWAARVVREVDAVGPRPTLADLPRLELTGRVFKEALRLYPPVYIFSRQAVEPVTVAGYAMPADTLVLICPYALHRAPSLWPDPERFDPDRFLPEREAGRHKLAWLPFGAGPRVCIGNQFAMMEGQLVLAALLSRARFEASAPATPDPHATLRPAGGMPMRVVLRGRA